MASRPRPRSAVRRHPLPRGPRPRPLHDLRAQARDRLSSRPRSRSAPTARPRWVLEANGTVFQALDDFADDFIERRCVERCDALISPSAYMLDWMRDRGLAAARAPLRAAVRALVAPSRASNRDRSAEHARGRTEIVFFGRLEPRKGVRVFCDALDVLAQDSEPLDLGVTFLGKQSSIDGIEAGEYLAARARRWPWAAEVIDDLGQPEAVAYLRSPGRRITVIPSLADNSPNTVYEALALQIPFIASRVGGTAELIDPLDLAAATFDPRAGRQRARSGHGRARRPASAGARVRAAEGAASGCRGRHLPRSARPLARRCDPGVEAAARAPRRVVALGLPAGIRLEASRRVEGLARTRRRARRPRWSLPRKRPRLGPPVS